MIRLSRQEKVAACIVTVTATIVWTGAALNWFGESLDTAPAPVEPATVVVPLAAVGDGSIQGVVNALAATVDSEEKAAVVDPPVEVAGVAPIASPSGQRVVTSGDCEGIAPGFPQEIAWRESRCTLGIDTGNGYYGYAQIARFHWQGGLCSDLDWTDLPQYNECVLRLWDGGAGAAHWAAG